MKAVTAGHHDRVIAGALAVKDKAPATVTSSAPAPKGGVVKGAAEGAAAGAAFEGVGAVPGAVIGGVTGGVEKHKSKKAARKAGGSSSVTKWASKAGPGRKLLVAEFLMCIAILALSPMTDKHKSEGPAAFMKRGASICALFFLLGLLSAGGRGPCKVAAAFGGVVTLALLVSSRDEFAVLAARFSGGPGNAGDSVQGDDVDPDGNGVPNFDLIRPLPGSGLPDQGGPTGTGLTPGLPDFGGQAGNGNVGNVGGLGPGGVAF